ncbi:MAG: hypothetical protein ABW221_27800 [Vicinamibacteria bacterium]
MRPKRTVALLLTVVAASPLSAQQPPAQPFETPPTIAASDLLLPEMLRGRRFTVAELVPTDGWTARFTLRSDFGPFEVAGTELLATRIAELEAIATLDEISKTSVFAESAKKAAVKPVRAVKAVVDEPVETAKALPAGVGRFFKRTYRKVRKGVHDAKDAKADAAARARGEEVPAAQGPAADATTGQKVGGVAKDVFGWNGARRQWARQLRIDPYTTNPVLSEKLDDVAWAAFSGGLAIGVVMPGLPGPVGTVTTASNLVWDLPPIDLEARNEKALAEMGAEGRLVRDFFRNEWFTPTLQTRAVVALEQMRVPGRREVVASAAAIPSEEEALFLVGALERLARLHEKEAPLDRLVVDDGVVSALDRKGAVVLAIPDDYVSWTEEVADVFAVYRGAAPAVWVAGRVSARARQELATRGWTVYENLQPR